MPERLGPVPEGPRARPAVPCDCSPRPKAHGFYQLSRATSARVQGPARSTGCPRGISPMPEGQPGPPDPGQLGPGSEVLRCRPALPSVSGPCPWSCGVDRRSRMTQPGSDGQRGRPDVPVNTRWCLRAHGFDQLSRATCARAQGPVGSTRYPGRLPPSPRFRGLNQFSRDTHTWVRGPMCSTSSPGRIVLGCFGLRGRPSLRATRAHA